MRALCCRKFETKQDAARRVTLFRVRHEVACMTVTRPSRRDRVSHHPYPRRNCGEVTSRGKPTVRGADGSAGKGWIESECRTVMAQIVVVTLLHAKVGKLPQVSHHERAWQTDQGGRSR